MNTKYIAGQSFICRLLIVDKKAYIYIYMAHQSIAGKWHLEVDLSKISTKGSRGQLDIIVTWFCTDPSSKMN